MSNPALLLICLLFFKHFLADFPLQTPYMMRKGAPTGWVVPLLAHCGVHAAFTAIILIPFVGWMFWLPTLVDFAAHFVIDTWKARVATYKIPDVRFWWALGFDQFLHAMTYIQITYLVMS